MALTLAKLTRPDAGEALLRERLFNQLGSARNCPLIWVNAPAGAGKTTLISSYIESKNERNLWYQIDKGDADMATFFHYMGQAVKSACHGRKKMPTLTPEYQLGVAEFTRNYFREVFGRFNAPALLVLDNFQDAGEGAEFYEMLAGAFSEIPKDINVVIISRTEPPAPFARLRANQQLSQIDWADLQFTIEEELAVTQQRYPDRNITKQQLQKLNAHIQGWISGLILLLEQGAELDKVELDNKELNPEYLFDYFATEIFYKIDKETQQFLIKTAMLPKMTASICKQLTGNRAASKILSELSRKQYFTVRHGVLNPSYEYHPLFRQFLLNQVHEIFDQDECKYLQSCTGLLLADTGDIDYGVNLLIPSGNWSALSALILKYAKQQIEAGRNKQVIRWINALPSNVVGQQPWLLYWLGMAKLQYENYAARDVLEKTYSKFKKRKDAKGLYLSWCGIADSYTFELDSFVGADFWIEELEWLLHSYPKPLSVEVRAHLTFSAACLLLWVQPAHSELPVWIKKVEIMHRFIPSKTLISMSAVLLSIYYGQIGEIVKLRQLSNRINKILLANDSKPFLTAILTLTAYCNNWITADFKLDLKLLGEFTQKIRDEGVQVFSGALLSQSLYHAMLKRDLSQYEILLDIYSAEIKIDNLLDQGHCQFHLCHFEILSGHLDRAVQYGKNAVELADQAGAPFPQSLFHALLAYTYIETEQYALARHHLDFSEQVIEGMKTFSGMFSIEMVRSFLAYRQKGETSALKNLQTCFSLGRKKDIRSWGNWPSTMISTLCGLALEHNIEPDYARSIIRIYNYTPEDSLHVGEHWPWPLKIYSLGRFSVLLNDKTLDTETRPFDILKVLLAFGGRDVHEEKIMDALWPDAEGDQSQASFKTSLHRLRKVFGELNVLVLKNHQLSLNEQYAWVDVWAMSRLFEPALQSIKIKDAVKSNELAGKLIQYYRGHFLSSEHTSWAIHQREVLRLRFIRHTLALAQFIENEDSQTAIQCYQCLLETDTLIEEAYQGLIRCYQSQGRQAEARASYEKCVCIFSAISGSSPSSATTELLK
jgi:DNA-binding SARP family transcriptional activator